MRPAAFHANAIVMVGCGFVGVDGVWVAGAGVKVAELRRDFAHAARSCRSRAHISSTGSVLGKLHPGGYMRFYLMESNYKRHRIPPGYL